MKHKSGNDSSNSVSAPNNGSDDLIVSQVDCDSLRMGPVRGRFASEKLVKETDIDREAKNQNKNKSHFFGKARADTDMSKESEDLSSQSAGKNKEQAE